MQMGGDPKLLNSIRNVGVRHVVRPTKANGATRFFSIVSRRFSVLRKW